MAVLVAGAGLRYGLSTALPFDAAELDQLRDASVRGRQLRVPFIMINGASLFLLYLRIGPRARALDGAPSLPAERSEGSVVFDREAAAFLLVPDPLLPLALRVVEAPAGGDR